MYKNFTLKKVLNFFKKLHMLVVFTLVLKNTFGTASVYSFVHILINLDNKSNYLHLSENLKCSSIKKKKLFRLNIKFDFSNMYNL